MCKRLNKVKESFDKWMLQKTNKQMKTDFIEGLERFQR